jgi:hypothetical protein
MILTTGKVFNSSKMASTGVFTLQDELLEVH